MRGWKWSYVVVLQRKSCLSDNTPSTQEGELVMEFFFFFWKKNRDGVWIAIRDVSVYKPGWFMPTGTRQTFFFLIKSLDKHLGLVFFLDQKNACLFKKFLLGWFLVLSFIDWLHNFVATWYNQPSLQMIDSNLNSRHSSHKQLISDV